VAIARSLGVDPQTVRKYTAAAQAAGLAPGGPPVSAGQWRAMARQWFPYLADTRLRQPALPDVAPRGGRPGRNRFSRASRSDMQLQQRVYMGGL
jgi:hypothetical protein